MATWEEIKALAADLRRVQLGDNAKRLSKRNCVELISKLIDTGLVDLVTSSDGKDYMTHDYLITQIKNEVIANGGRVSLSDVHAALGVQYQQVEDHAELLLKNDTDFTLCLGQLITKDYVENLCREVDSMLDSDGRVSVAQLSKRYDLPTEFLRAVIHQRIPLVIHGIIDPVDPHVLYTDSFVRTQTAVIRGALCAVTRTIAVERIVKEFQLEPSLFFKCFDELRSQGRLYGTLTGGRSLEKAVYIPDVYVAAFERYITDFYKQNGYVESATIRKYCAGDFGQVVSRLTKNELRDALRLKDSLVSHGLLQQAEGAAEEAIGGQNWVDLKTIFPAGMTLPDVASLANRLHGNHPQWIKLEDCLFYKKDLVTGLEHFFDPLIFDKVEKAHDFIKEQPMDAAVAAGGKTPAGSGKEHKNRKKRQPAADDKDAAEKSSKGNVFMTAEEVRDYLANNEVVPDCPEALLERVADELCSTLQSKYLTQLERSMLFARPDNRKLFKDFEVKFQSLYAAICMFDMGASLFPDLIAEQLRVYLLRSLCSELSNLALASYADVPNPDKVTKKIRDAIIGDMSNPAADQFTQLFASLEEKSLNPFYEAVNSVCLPSVLGVNLRSLDKKAKSAVLQHHKEELLDQLKGCEDPTMGLLLCCTYLFSHVTSNILHASGKFVPHVVALIQDKLPANVAAILQETQARVVQLLKSPDATTHEEASASFDKLRNEIVAMV